MSTETFGPLPNSPVGPVGRGVVVISVSTGHGQSPITRTNGVKPVDNLHLQSNRFFQLIMHVALSTFKTAPGEPGAGGVMFVTRVDKDILASRLENPLLPLVGPHLIDMFVCLSVNQLSTFMALFQQFVLPIEEEGQRKKKRKTEAIPIGPCDHRNICGFEHYKQAATPAAIQRFRFASMGHVVNIEKCTMCPCENASTEDLVEFLTLDDDKKNMLHPMILCNAKDVVNTLKRRKDYPFTPEDFLRYEGSEVVLEPSKRVKDAALCRTFTPGEFVSYNTNFFGEADASTFLRQIPWFCEPSPSQIRNAFERIFKVRTDGSVVPEAADYGFDESSPDFSDWHRLSILGQQFSDKARARMSQYRHRMPLDPSRVTKIPGLELEVGGTIGLSALRRQYPRLWTLSMTNARAFELCRTETPVEALKCLQRVAKQAMDIAQIGGDSGLTPNFFKLQRSIMDDINGFQRDTRQARARACTFLFPHKITVNAAGYEVGQMLRRDARSGLSLTPLMYMELWLRDNLRSFLGVMPTQQHIVIATWVGLHRVMTAGLRSLDFAFYGDPGIGKTFSMGLAAEMVDENVVMSKGSGSDQSIVYKETNEDNKFTCRDESEFFEDSEGGKRTQRSTVSARQIAREKTRLESAVVQHETTTKQIDPESGLEKHVTLEIDRVLRGGSATNANGPPINRALRTRLAEIDCENPGISGSFSALPVGPMQRQFFRITRLFHSVSQVSCCLLEHFVKSAFVEIDTTAVDVILAILRTVDSSELGFDVPTQRKQKDLEKAAEAFCIQEVTSTLWGCIRARAGAGESEGEGEGVDSLFSISHADLCDLVVRASLNLVVSSQATISAFWLLFPLSGMKIRKDVEKFVFGGDCLMLKPFVEQASVELTQNAGAGRRKTGAKPYAFPWMAGAAVRVGNNQYLASHYESVDVMGRMIYNEIRGTQVKCPSEVTIVKMLTSMMSAPPMRPASLQMMDVPFQGRKGNVMTSQRVCILGAALNRSTTDVEAALLSGFLRLIDVTPVDELVFGFDDTRQGPKGWVLFQLDQACSTQTEFVARRTSVLDGVSGAWKASGAGEAGGAPHTFCFTQNALCVLDPHHILGQTGANEASQAIATGIQRGEVHSVSPKVRELQRLLSREYPDMGVLSAPVDSSASTIWTPGGEAQGSSAKILSQLTIQRQLIATTSKNPPWEGGCPPFLIVEGCDSQTFKLKSSQGGRVSSPLHPNVKLYECETTSQTWYAKVYLDRSVDIVQSIRERSDLPKELVRAIQDFDNVMTGSAAWRRKNEPACLAGATVKITPSGQAVLNSTFVPFKESEGREVRDIRYVESAVGSMSMTMEEEEREDLSGRDAGVFPGTSRFVKLKFGQNIHAKQVRARFTQFFGPGWEGVPEIEKLMSPWVREISEGDEDEDKDEGAGEVVDEFD